MRRSLFLILLAISLPLVAARQRAVRHPSAAPPVTGPTFSNEVVRIFQQHCQNCHHDGDIAPFSLVTYDEAKPHATLIKIMTQTRQMPPWKPADGCGDFLDERRLSDAEIATLAKWADAGAPEGNRADLPAPIDFSSGWRLGQPDLIFANAEAYTPPAGKDTYRCFTIPTNLTTDAWVRAVDTHPGNRAIVHHVLTFIDTTGASVALDEAEEGPGYTCFGGPGFSLPGTLGGWAPGSPPLELPENVGFELPAGSRLVLQVHYHPHDGDSHGVQHIDADRTELGVYLAAEKPAQAMRVVPLVNMGFTIPPHDANYRVDAELPIKTPFPIKIWFVAPHMHLLGRKMTVQMTPPNGIAQCLIDIQDWDFNWQGAYRYKSPIDVPAGSRLSLTAWYDNSTSNPRNPNNPPKPVSWGEETTDEMCLAFLGVTVE
ncbi:MAG TPA: ascorbate-dependent monooxygenase [Thermoanaerobaculia bacterium]|nr:ascorbate-dependent monooxygenase [Thermoanaerobaculia bacterium]